jgi:peptide-methionine (S)-S-oxide reductase
MMRYFRTFFLTIFLGLSFVAHSMAVIPEGGYEMKSEVAIFAGGCFWCEAEVFAHLEGILSVESGFTGGTVDHPTYHQVSKGGTGHLESVRVTFDPIKIPYEKLLEQYWRNVDPFDAQGQFCDRGDSYQSAIFYLTSGQKQAAEISKAKIQSQFPNKPVATAIRQAGEFYPAEDYHQQYAEKNPVSYQYYRLRCGRDKRIKEIWG